LQGELELSIATVPLPVPEADEVIVRIEAAPINPSDLGLLLGPADMRNAKITGDGVVRAPIPTKSLLSVKTRIGVLLRGIIKAVTAGIQRMIDCAECLTQSKGGVPCP
jgi:hypothetical protein